MTLELRTFAFIIKWSVYIIVAPVQSSQGKYRRRHLVCIVPDTASLHKLGNIHQQKELQVLHAAPASMCAASRVEVPLS